MANNDWRTKRMAAIRKLATEDNSAQKERERRTYSPENYMNFVRRLVANSTNDPNSAAESAKVQRTIARPRTYTLLAGDKTLSDQRKEELTKEAAMNVRPTARDTAKWAYDVRENGQNDTQANVLGKGTQYMVSDAYLQSNIDAMKNRIASAQQNNADILADDSKMHASELQADKNRAITEYVMDTIQNGKSYDAEAIAGLKAVFGEMSDRDALKMLSQIHSDPEAFLNKQLHSSEETVKFDHNIGLYEDALGGMETEQANREMVASARASEDWDSASQYAMRTGKNYQYARSLGNVGLADDLGFDVKYDFINNPDYFDAAEGYNPLEYESYLMEWRTQGLDMLTPDEVDEFNYFSSQSDEAGQRYLDSKSSELTRRAAEASREYMNYLADEYPISTYLMAAATNVANAFTYPVQVIDALDGSVDNTGAFGQFTQGIRQRQGENAAEALDWEVPLTGQPLGGLLYNTSTGYVDFALAALTGSGLGGANAAAATQAIMGSQVASATLQSDLDAGVSPVGAVAHSMLAAGIEALTEKYSIEAFLADPVTTMRHVAKNFFTEASEEGASNLLNIVGDEFIQKLTGNESEIMRQYNELIVSGMSEQEAANSVLQDFVQNLSGDMLVGGLVGAMAGGTSAFAYNAKGSQLKKSGTGEQLMQIAEQMPEDSKSKKLANKITKTKSNFATAQLYNTLADELPGAQDVLDNITAAGLANQLRDEGEEGDTQAVAKSIVKLLRGNQLTAEEYSALAQSKHGMSVLDATVKINQRDSGEMHAYDTAYKAGFYGQQAAEGMNTEYYQAGVEAAQKAEQARLNRVGKVGLKGGGVTYVGAASTRADVYGGKVQALNTETLAPQQRVAVQALEGLSEVSGMNFVLYEGQADANGNITIENGSYDGKTNTIYLDLNAGKNRADQGVVNYAILRTAAHEMTHFIESNSKDGYAALKKFVVNELTARGQNFDALVENKLRNAQRQGIELTRGGAVAEVIADACEMALKDTQAIRRLAKQDKSLYGRIKSFLRDLMGKIRKALEGVKATHPEARALMEAEKYIDGLQKLWDDALVEAVETARSVEETDVENRSETVQVLSEAVDETGQPMLSLRSMEEDYDTYRAMLKTAGATDTDINALFDTIDAVMDAVRANRAKLDFGENIGREDRAFLPIKPNSDPLYKVSLDFSSLCRKRLLQQAVQERLETKYNTVLTKAERVAVRQALLEVQKEGLQIEVACALCYVEAARLKSPAQIARFMDNKRANLVDFFSKESKAYSKEIDAKVAQMTEQLGYAPNTPMSQMSKADKKKIQNAKKAMYPAYKPTAEEKAIIRTAESLPESMYKTEKGLWQLKREHPEIFAAYTTFVRNATKSKGIEGDTPFYAGDTATISDGLIKAMNEENGTRSQSWSDFQVIHILDYMAAIIEFSTRNAKMQSYTKVPDFVKLMGNTGMMINLSLIPNDFNGELTFDPVEGMAYETAQLLRDTYHGTVGNISIGISNDHIRALLADAGIDYVIPYHKSSMDKKTRDAIGLKKWEDYENSQNEKERTYPETDSDGDKYHKKPRFSEWYNHTEAMAIAKAAQANAPAGDVTYGARVAMREMANRYKQLCHERGLQEKFAQFAEEENYWKLLIDRKMIDQVTGELIEQKAVKPVFNKADILDILSDEVARFDKVNADFEEAAARIDKMWAAGDIRKAAKSKTIIDQVAAFEDAVVVRNIAASAEGVQLSSREVNKEAYELSDAGVSFSIREEDPPKKTSARVYEEYRVKSAQLQNLLNRNDQMTKSEEFASVMDLIRTDPNAGVEQYKKLLDKYELSGQSISELQKETNALYSEYKKLVDLESKQEEERAVAKSGKSAAEYHRSQAVKVFGYTPYFVDAGYLLPNGKMLNFSGEKGKHYGMRGEDHRAIGQVFANVSGSEAMVHFMHEGNIRLMPESPGMDIATTTEPTNQQYAAIRKFVREYANQEQLSIDFTDENGREVGSLVYDGRILADRVVNDIRHYFETGEIREQGVSAFHYSLRETTPADWTEQYLERVRPSDIVDAAEADNLRIYQKRLAEYRKAKDAYERQVALLDSGTLKGDELIRQRNRVNMSKGIVDRLEASVKEARNAKAMQSLTEKAETFVRHNLVGKDSNQLKQIILNKENEIRQLKVRIDKGEVELKAQREKAMRDLRQLRSSAAQDMVNMQKVSELSYAAGAKVRHIQKGVKALHNLRVNETDYKNIPEHLKAFVGDVVKIFGDSYGSMVWSSQKASQISELYAKLKSPDGPYAEISPFYDPDMEETLHELSEWAKTYEKLATKDWHEAYKNLVPAQDQNTDSPRLMRAQLRYLMDEAVADLVDHVNAIVRNSRNLFNAGRKQQFAQIGTAVKDELLEREDKTVLLGKPGTVAKWIDNAIRTGNITPVYFFEQLGNHELSALFNDFRQGQEEYAFTLDAVQDKIRNLKEQYDYNAWKDAEELAFQTSQGHNITLTKEQALWLYATWKREQANDIAATEHLTKGGFVYEGNADPNGKKGLLQKGRSNTTGHLISEKDMAVVDNYLTAEEKAYADAMVELLSKDMAALGNRVSMEMFGIRKYKEKYYFPYKTVGDQLNQTSLTGATNTTDDSRLKHGGFTHRLTSKARTALVMGNFSDVVANHVSQMVTYSSFVLPIENMNRVLNYRFETDDGSQSTIRSLIRQKYGENALKYIETFLHDMNGGIRSDTRSGVGALVSLHKKAAVVASLSVALQQPSSILRAAALMNPKYLLKGTVTKADYEELKEHSGVAIIKQMGRFDTNVGRSNVEWLLEDDYSKLTAWQQVKQALNPKDWESFKYRWNVLATGLPTVMDEISWGKLWNAVKAEQADLHPDMDHSSDEFLDMCGERFNDIVDHTQVYDSLLAKSQLMRSKSDIDKMVTSFAAEPTLTLNMLYDAFTNKNHSERSKRIWGTVFSITASSLAAAIGSALISAWNKDDDKRTAQEKLLNKTVSAFIDNMNPLNNIPYIRDLYNLMQGYEVERADMSIFSDIVSAVQKVKSSNYTGYRKVEELAGSIANLFGVPVKNVMRDLRRIYNAATSDWTDPTQTGIETAWVDAVDEAFPFVDWYKTGVNDYYERDLNAMLEGDKAMVSDISRYLREVRGKEDKDIMSGVKSAAKDRVKNGSLASQDAINALTKAYPDDVDADTLYWDYEKLKTGSTTKYEAFYTAIESGKDLQKEIQRYLDNGVSKETLADMISKKYQTTLAELYKTNKTKAADLQAKLLAAYVLLGYDREKKLKDIKKWYE